MSNSFTLQLRHHPVENLMEKFGDYLLHLLEYTPGEPRDSSVRERVPVYFTVVRQQVGFVLDDHSNV